MKADMPRRKSEARVIADMGRLRGQLRRIDGRLWVDADTICRVLGLRQDSAFSKVERAHRMQAYEFRRGYRSTRLTLFDREGVESLVIARGGLSRSRVMEALDAQLRDGVAT